MARIAKPKPVYNSRGLVYIPISKASKDSRLNYSKTIQDKDQMVWGFDGSKNRTSILHSSIRRGDGVVITFAKKAVAYAVVTKVYEDAKKHLEVNWTKGSDFNLIIEMDRVDFDLPDILDELGYVSSPNGSQMVAKDKAHDFWLKHEASFPKDTSTTRALAPKVELREKTYRQKLDSATSTTWRRFEKQIDPDGFGRGLGADGVSRDLDHGVSALVAELIDMPIWMASDQSNLHLIEDSPNREKSFKCRPVVPFIRSFGGDYEYLVDRYERLNTEEALPWQKNYRKMRDA